MCETVSHLWRGASGLTSDSETESAAPACMMCDIKHHRRTLYGAAQPVRFEFSVAVVDVQPRFVRGLNTEVKTTDFYCEVFFWPGGAGVSRESCEKTCHLTPVTSILTPES
eukprot:3418977-Prymnesium_polylepis.1